MYDMMDYLEEHRHIEIIKNQQKFVREHLFPSVVLADEQYSPCEIRLQLEPFKDPNDNVITPKTWCDYCIYCLNLDEFEQVRELALEVISKALGERGSTEKLKEAMEKYQYQSNDEGTRVCMLIDLNAVLNHELDLIGRKYIENRIIDSIA